MHFSNEQSFVISSKHHFPRMRTTAEIFIDPPTKPDENVEQYEMVGIAIQSDQMDTTLSKKNKCKTYIRH